MNESQVRAGLHAVLRARPFRYPEDAYESPFHFFAAKLVVKQDQSEYKTRAEWLECALCSESLPDFALVNLLLEQIVSVETRETQRFEFRQAVLSFLNKQLETNTAQIRWCLQFIGKHCLGFIHQEPFTALRHEIFAKCIQIQNTEGCCDLQIQQMLCDMLQDLQMPPDVWKQTLESTSQIQHQARTDACANIFEQCLKTPSKYALYAQQIAENVSPDEMSEHVSIPLCFALYKTCYPTEMSLLEEKLHDLKLLRNESVQLSAEFTNLLQMCEKWPFLATMQDIDRLAVDLTLQPMNEISIQAYDTQQNQDIPKIPQEKILSVLRECNLALNVTPERFLIPLSLAIRILLDSASKVPETNVWRECCSVYLSAWSNAFASQLNKAVYEESSAMHSLARRVLCFAIFHDASTMDCSSLEIEMQKLCRYYQVRQVAFAKGEENVELIKRLLQIPVSAATCSLQR